MNKEKILLDFAVFVLLDIEELCSSITNFFNQTNRKDYPFDFNLLNYEEYLRQEILVEEIIENNDFKSELKSLNDLLSSIELNNLKGYLNNNFGEGFPDGDGTYRGNNPLEIQNSDLVRYFNAYLKHREINKDVFITYYIQLFETLNKSVSDKLKLEVEKIQNIRNTKDLLDLKLSNEYTESEHLKYKQKLFKSIKKNNFQYKGLADDKGLYFDERKTLNSYLEFLNKNEIQNFNYPVKLPIIDKSLNYLVYKYYLFVLYDKQLDSTDNKIYNPLIELNEFNANNKGILDYIKSKGFDDSEIDFFINTIHDGCFNNLEIRYININQVQLFHLYYCFYVFEYFENVENCNFEAENDFEKVLRLQTVIEYDKHTLNQFYKYYNQTSCVENKHYPFKTIDKTISRVVDTLKIEKGKLKPIPKTKK